MSGCDEQTGDQRLSHVILIGVHWSAPCTPLYDALITPLVSASLRDELYLNIALPLSSVSPGGTMLAIIKTETMEWVSVDCATQRCLPPSQITINISWSAMTQTSP